MIGRVNWFADVLLSDRPAAAKVAVQTLLDGGRDPRSIYVDVLGPALEEVGRRWECGSIDVAQEHLATSVVASIMDMLAPRFPRADPSARTIALAGTAGDLHAMGLDMVEDFLTAEGWEVHNFGAATPPDGLVKFVRTVGIEAVGLSTGLTTHLRTAEQTIAILHRLKHPPFIIVGGQAYGGSSAAALAVGADAYAEDARAATAVLRERFPRTDATEPAQEELVARTAALREVVADNASMRARMATLAALLPVCGSCGRLRHDPGDEVAWRSIAGYLSTIGLTTAGAPCTQCAGAHAG